MRQLQKILNMDADTTVQTVGPGSPGEETDYFGVLTYDAVVRFQEKYREEILMPNGLSYGTGFVGSSTIEELSSLHGGVATPPVQTPISMVSPISTTQTNPNLVNLDKFLSAIDEVSKKQGMSPSAVELAKAQVLKDAATSTDLREAFMRLVGGVSSSGDRSTLSRAVEGAVGFIERAFAPGRAFAQTADGSTPFGGALLYSFFCTCSGNWLVTVEPLPPTFVTLLTYQPGSQAFLSYNIPETSWLLGGYTAGGLCSVIVGPGCAVLPSEGTISPMTGSSLE